MRARGQALPPGYQAHLACSTPKSDRPTRRPERLVAEKERFPESSGFMDFLISKVAGKGAP